MVLRSSDPPTPGVRMRTFKVGDVAYIVMEDCWGIVKEYDPEAGWYKVAWWELPYAKVFDWFSPFELSTAEEMDNPR
jgi:hypothetical protein